MEKRLFELAKELGVRSMDIINYLKFMDVQKTNYSRLDKEEIDLIKNNIEIIKNNNNGGISNNNLLASLHDSCKYKYDKFLFFALISFSKFEYIILSFLYM